jgi:hypothetical protein
MRLALFTGFWIKYFDYFLISKRGALAGASALYFIGRKRDIPFLNHEVISMIVDREY